MEVGRDGQTVDEVAAIDEIAGTADMEHDRDVGLLRHRPDRVERPVRWRVPGRAPAGHEQRGSTHRHRFGSHRRGQ